MTEAEMAMIGKAAAAIALTLFGACNAKSGSSATTTSRQTNQAVPPSAPMPPPPGYAPALTSAFEFNGTIPVKFTCDGAGEAPPLHWTAPREGTRSFALVVDDPDASGGTFYHWGVYDIPVTARSIVNGQAPAQTLMNDFGKPGYGPPCPPKGSGLHHYRFKLYGLKVSHLELRRNARIGDLEAAVLRTAALGGASTESMLIGFYERK